jgi:hypothetical protein
MTSFLVMKNRAQSKLNGAIDDDDLSLIVTTGEGARFPSTYPFHITIDDEILECTDRSTDTLTVTRGGQGTTPASHPDKSYVALNITAQSFTDLNTAVNALEALTAAQFAKAIVIMDLSGGAVSDVPILHTSRALTLIKALILYTEASSGDAGITLKIGKETDDDFYYTGTSEINKAKWYELDVTLLQTAIAAGDTVVCSSAGSKAGTGEVLICLEFKVV